MSELLLSLCIKRGLDANYASSGAELAMPCPLCDDHKPRLYVNITTLKWTCFNCQEAGWGERFLTQVLHLDGIAAGRYLTQLLGQPRAVRIAERPTAPLPDIEWPIFTERLDSTSDPKQWRYWEYLHHRGIKVAHVVHYGIRYCPIGKYEERVVVPIFMEGVLRGWCARLIRPTRDGEVKVLTPKGMKSALILFGLEHVKGDSCVLVEGVFDAMAFPEGVGVAALGAKLSPVQRDLLRRRGIKRVITMFDNDEAGHKGTRRAAGELVAAGFEVYMALLPEGKDPGSADVLELEQAIARAIPVRSDVSIQSQLNQVIKGVKENNDA